MRGCAWGTILAFTLGCGHSSSPGSPTHGDSGSPDGGRSDATLDAPVDGARDAAAEAAAPYCTLPSSSPFSLRFDPIGYLPEGAKWAVLVSQSNPPPQYQVVDAKTGATVASGVAGPRVLSTTSRAGTPLTGDRVDLSALTQPGRYTVVLVDGSKFGPIVVDPNAYATVVPSLLRFLGVQRCGPTDMATSQHAACHLFSSIAGSGTFSGDGIAVDDGYTGSVDSTTGPAVDVEGGWHDAGDYIKFLGTTSFVLTVDLLALRDHGTVLAGPRMGAVRDALRAEMRWGLDWVRKMLGGAEMYHQVSGSKDHDVDWRIPEADTTMPIPGYTERPVFRFAQGAGGNLIARAAAAMALGSQVYSDDAAYSAQLLTLAKTLFTAAVPLTTAQSSDPPDFYTEDTVDDDLSLAAAVLAQITGDATYASDALMHAQALEGSPPTTAQPLYWGDLTSLAFLETGFAFAAGSAERTEMAQDLTALAAPVLASGSQPQGPGAAFGYALTTFDNGSIEESLGAASVCLMAERLGGNAGCSEVARTQLHWLFGQNPFGLSFMVGMGCAYPANVHHALAQAAGITIPGAVVGGPTSLSVLMGLGDPSVDIPTSASPFAPFSTDGLLYDDDVTDYVVNEPAIDFTAPLVYDLAALLDSSP